MDVLHCREAWLKACLFCRLVGLQLGCELLSLKPAKKFIEWRHEPDLSPIPPVVFTRTLITSNFFWNYRKWGIFSHLCAEDRFKIGLIIIIIYIAVVSLCMLQMDNIDSFENPKFWREETKGETRNGDRERWSNCLETTQQVITKPKIECRLSFSSHCLQNPQ